MMWRQRGRRVVLCACITWMVINFVGWARLHINRKHSAEGRVEGDFKQFKENKTSPGRTTEVNIDEYKARLTTHASKEGIILLALVDSSFIDMTFNFYETSILRFSIDNYLFIASDHQACQTLATKRINCYVYMIDANANRTTVFRSYAFNQKMNIRTFLILDALKLGFTVLHTDVDVVFLSNPLQDLRSSVHADIACLSDTGACNAGFIYVKPSEFSIDVYTRMRTTALRTKLDDQTALNKALEAAVRKNRKYSGRKQMLDAKKYQCGVKYFEYGNRYFAGSATCPQCTVVHNNWIVSKEAKRYRFREVLLWSYDDNGYYSNREKHYLMYSNAPLSGTTNYSSSAVELDALKTALYLGHILDRVVILPRFHLTSKKMPPKQGAERPLNNWINIASFDDYFYEKYRENSFLQHEKVPQSIKQNITKPFWIKTNHSATLLKQLPSDVTVLVPTDQEKATTEDISNWLGGEQSAVLNFHSLYGVFGVDSIPKSAKSFSHKLEKAFKRSDYRQLKR